MSPEQYERYKKEVLPIRMQNRIYVSWTNSTGLDCKLIGPETPCFCGHRYRQHQTDFKEIPNERPIKLQCKQKQCRCVEYYYLPPNIRCSCKHLIVEHAPDGLKKCSKGQSYLLAYPPIYCGHILSNQLSSAVVLKRYSKMHTPKPVGITRG